ncbi:hypothetical protein WJX79_008941 [Trebouxia sp. C0005]
MCGYVVFGVLLLIPRKRYKTSRSCENSGDTSSLLMSSFAARHSACIWSIGQSCSRAVGRPSNLALLPLWPSALLRCLPDLRRMAYRAQRACSRFGVVEEL